MAKVITEARANCPELVEAVKLFDRLAYTRNYSEVFNDFINWLVWQHYFPLPDEAENPLSKYKKEEQERFASIYQLMKKECLDRISLYRTGEQGVSSWYDPLGRVYECITSKNKSSAMGQFFTPEHLVDLMAQITFSGADAFTRVLDPACGSGRLGIAGAMYLMAKGIPCWVSMIDIDPLCTKMTAINMCLNGVVGEVLCMDGLDITGNTYRFGYLVFPLLHLVPPEQWDIYQMLMYMRTKQDVKKQYVITPIEYEHTYLKIVNDNLLAELEKRAKFAKESEREKAIQEIQELIKERMKGTLFEGDTLQFAPDGKPSAGKQKNKPKSKKQDTTDAQGSLFE